MGASGVDGEGLQIVLLAAAYPSPVKASSDGAEVAEGGRWFHWRNVLGKKELKWAGSVTLS